MKAAIVTRYGTPDVVQIVEVATPRAKPGQVVVRQHATTVNSGDSRIRSAKMPPGFGLILRLVFGLRGPRQPIFGICVAGEVVEVGPGVTTHKVGDRVLATTGFPMRAHAEYVAIRADRLVPLPAGLTMDQAAALPFGALTALYYLRDRAKVQRGETVLVIGATGAVGAATMQLARHFGATVTAVCSAANADLARSLGASQVIDYRTQDYRSMGQRYDIIVDCIGDATAENSRQALVPGGRLCLVVTSLAYQLTAAWHSRRTGVRVLAGVGRELPEDLRLLTDLAAQGALRPYIGAILPFAQIADAHALAETGHKRGNTVIQFGETTAAT
jgi:NADPH:quinone reductase-like Zn-dependent oxidoreductase